jgi:hypothetical protein
MMKKLYVTLNIVTAALWLTGAFFVNRFGMVLLGIGLFTGLVGGIIRRIYFRKRLNEDIGNEMEKLIHSKKKNNDQTRFNK